MNNTFDLHTQAVLDHLAAAGVLVGDGKKPDGAGWTGPPGQSPFVPYTILWRLGAKDRSSWSLDGDHSESKPLMYVRSFGGTRAEAEVILGAAVDALLDQTIQVPGRTVLRVTLDTTTTTSRSDDVEVGLFEAGAYLRLWTDPA